MGRVIRSLWQHHRLLFLAFCAAALITLFLAARTAAFYAYWSMHRAVPIEDWMTIGYVARSWDVPPQTLRGALGLATEGHDRRSIARIAAERGVPAGMLIDDIEKAVADARSQAENEAR